MGGGYCRLQMPLRLALGVRDTVAGQRLGALEGVGGLLPCNASLGTGWGAIAKAKQVLRSVLPVLRKCSSFGEAPVFHRSSTNGGPPHAWQNGGRAVAHKCRGIPRDASEGKGPQRRLDRRLEEVAQAVWRRLLSVTNAIEAGTWRPGDSGWAEAGRPGGGGGNLLQPPA